jgi:hypothetical protein
MILVVGKPKGWTALARRVPPDEELRFVGIEDLTVARLGQLRPTLVLSPLIGEGFDAVDVVHRLASAAFQGRFRVVASSVPNPEAVRAELQAAGDEIDFDLVVLGLRPH